MHVCSCLVLQTRFQISKAVSRFLRFSEPMGDWIVKSQLSGRATASKSGIQQPGSSTCRNRKKHFPTLTRIDCSTAGHQPRSRCWDEISSHLEGEMFWLHFPGARTVHRQRVGGGSDLSNRFEREKGAQCRIRIPSDQHPNDMFQYFWTVASICLHQELSGPMQKDAKLLSSTAPWEWAATRRPSSSASIIFT